jgi:serine phosphatase RsbU (regulator of sigma subunit)
MFRNIRIGVRITISFFMIAFFSILVIGYISYSRGKVSLEEESFNRLTAVREMKASQIEDYFQNINDQVTTFSRDHTIIEATKRFRKGFDEIEKDLAYSAQDKFVRNSLEKYYENEFLERLNKNLDEQASLDQFFPENTHTQLLQYLYISSNKKEVGKKHELDRAGDNSFYSETHEIYHPYFRNYLEKFGYYDIFLVDHITGNIIYTVFKEVDFATSLIDGPYKDANISEVFREAAAADSAGKFAIVDYEPYYPSYYAPAAFISAPVFDGDEKIGVLIFQLPIDRINNIMTNRHEWNKVGLGLSGETYIVGEDFTLRNQSRFLIEDSSNYFKMIREIGTPEKTIAKIRNFNSTIGLQEVRTKGTEQALKGVTNFEIFPDYRGVAVLSAYKPLNIEGMHWAIMSEIDEEEAFGHVYSLRRLIIIVFIGLAFAIIFISMIVARRITRPLKSLTSSARQLAKGNLETPIVQEGKDEIGILSLSFKKMQISITNLIGELKDINHNLENKVIERTQEIQHQKEMVEEKNKEILDSINYAKRLQTAILPTAVNIKKALPQSFILFKPKDIVSGDFYWMDDREKEVLIAAVDCTGHGVPGAMVSVVGANGLNRCVKEFGLTEPGQILDMLTKLVVETFSTSEHEVKDGMDIALCRLNKENNMLQYSGAHNPLWVLRKGAEEIEEIRADKQPIGMFDYRKPHITHSVQLNPGDTFYVFTDGFGDQFGGTRGKKYKASQMKEVLISIRNESMENQKAILNESFESWRGNLEQIDDVCVIGVRV